MRITRRGLLGIGVVLMSAASADAGSRRTVRWDIVSLDPGPPVVIDAGGIASARADDGSKITLTGSGTFRTREGSNNVTGGGTWETFDSDGASTGSGTYEVIRILSWNEAPGMLGGVEDRIGDLADARAGLAVLRIRFSDGEPGVLTVSCHLGGTPDSVFEGITTSKGFVTFWNREAPEPGVDANRTLFHVVRD